MKNNQTLSVVLAVFNEEKNLPVCLESIKGIANEIVVVDGSSTDGTVAVAKIYNATVIVTSNPPIFHINKQKAVDHATGDWILQLDADEIVSPELAVELLEIINNPQAKNGYYLARKNYFITQWMKRGGMYPDYVVRLFKKGKGSFPQKSVHEQITIDGEIGYVKAPLIHKPYPTFSEYMRKADTYTSLTRDEMIQSRTPISFFSFVKYMVYRPARTFFSLYIRHKGILDGYWGFVWALFSGFHFAWAYSKYLVYARLKK